MGLGVTTTYSLVESIQRIEGLLGSDSFGVFYYSGAYEKGCGRLIAVLKPRILYELRRSGAIIEGRGSGEIAITGDPFTDLAAISRYVRRVRRGIPILGILSYESLIYAEKSLSWINIDDRYPLALFMVPETYVSIDLCSGYAELASPWGSSSSKIYGNKSRALEAELELVSHDEKAFMDLVEEAKKRIHDGEVFQIVLSRYKIYRYSGNPLYLYRKLSSNIEGNPYLYVIRSGDLWVIGASPEPLIVARGNTVDTFPVAGTRKRVRGMDREIYMRLLSNAKERAEHMMLVDLARNDLGRICIPGSVRVSKLMFPQILPNVIHLVSRVRGSLRSFDESFEAFRSLFPAGTVTGAPKHRAMWLISTFEGTPRGIYAGAIGYIEDLYMNFAITIRTAVFHRDRLRLQAGAGIVIDSKPRDEYIETENKMSIIERLLGRDR
ncbi:MAG TPA: anthranilate synthase component I family protein [Sulfolobales archaeon]|nr:anthranilate synthase component I family protein [Sulfolobales archaeon]